MRPPVTRKWVFFALETINSLSTTWFFFYVYFFAETKFGFDRQENLFLAAGLGLVYAGASVVGGRMAQGWGSLKALAAGCALMGGAQAVGAITDSMALHGLLLAIGISGMGMTWPSLQALVSEGESGRRLQTMVGIYNVVWSLAGALAYFTGGAMLEAWGLRSMFLVPALLNALMLGIIAGLNRRPAVRGIEAAVPSATQALHREEMPVPIGTRLVDARAFLKMAWFANPFAYLAINTVVASAPAIGQQLALSPRLVGYVCSIWMFVRSASFVMFWWWPGWHYRFPWLAAAFAGLVLSFVGLLLAPTVALLIAAQLAFGISIGLIYYSSLFYSMDASDTRGAHGGIHEAAIGLGCFAGPAVGATMASLAPHAAGGTAKAVGALLLAGFLGLLWIRRSSRKRAVKADTPNRAPT